MQNDLSQDVLAGLRLQGERQECLEDPARNRPILGDLQKLH